MLTVMTRRKWEKEGERDTETGGDTGRNESSGVENIMHISAFWILGVGVVSTGIGGKWKARQPHMTHTHTHTRTDEVCFHSDISTCVCGHSERHGTQINFLTCSRPNKFKTSARVDLHH